MVSILTRPWGRVQPGAWRAACRLCQSRFNPHPPVGAGATQIAQPPWCRFGVSILTRPWGRVHRRTARPTAGGLSVSILTRPWGRVQQLTPAPRLRQCVGFNPHPPVGAGATSFAHALVADSLFQSSPARGGGCNASRSRTRCPPRVSILTRPWGRVQPSQHQQHDAPDRFQSSPARGGGCNFFLSSTAFDEVVVSILTRPWGRVQPEEPFE